MNRVIELPVFPCPKCNSAESEMKNVVKDNGYDISEYSLYCICGEYLGTFSYGHWEYTK